MTLLLRRWNKVGLNYGNKKKVWIAILVLYCGLIFICEPILTKLGLVFSNVIFEAEKDMQLL